MKTSRRTNHYGKYDKREDTVVISARDLQPGHVMMSPSGFAQLVTRIYPIPMTTRIDVHYRLPNGMESSKFFAKSSNVIIKEAPRD